MLFRLAYELLYPAFLGSMAYQVVFEGDLRFHRWWVQACLALIYILDWWYIRNVYAELQKEIKPDEITTLTRGRKRYALIAIDFFSAVALLWTFRMVYNVGVADSDNHANYMAAHWWLFSVIAVYFLFHLVGGLTPEAVVLCALVGVFVTGALLHYYELLTAWAVVLSEFIVVVLAYLAMNIGRQTQRFGYGAVKGPCPLLWKHTAAGSLDEHGMPSA